MCFLNRNFSLPEGQFKKSTWTYAPWSSLVKLCAETPVDWWRPPPVGLEFREAMSNDHGPWAPSNRMFMGHLAKRPGCQPIFSSLTSWISLWKMLWTWSEPALFICFIRYLFSTNINPFPGLPGRLAFSESILLPTYGEALAKGCECAVRSLVGINQG